MGPAAAAGAALFWGLQQYVCMHGPRPKERAAGLLLVFMTEKKEPASWHWEGVNADAGVEE